MHLIKLSANAALAVLAASTFLVQQQPASNSSPTPPTSAEELTEIRVDHHCRILTPTKPTAANPAPQPKYRYNVVVCHIESDLKSQHWEKAPNNRANKLINVHEREYLLQNTTDKPVAFLIDQPLRKGWSIDSDPQPIAIVGTTATFRVIAEPRQIVRLHVGERS